MQYTYPYYDIVLPEIRRIQAWFKKVYGINVSIQNVLLFTFHSLESVSQVSFKSLHNKAGDFKDLNTKVVQLDEDYDLRIADVVDVGKTLKLNRAFVISSLIVWRAATLPNISSEAKRAIRVLRESKPDREKFKPRIYPIDYYKDKTEHKKSAAQ